MFMPKESIEAHLTQTLSEIDTLISVTREVARNQGQDIYQLRDPRGELTFPPLLQMRLETLKALVQLSSS